ncbi:MAG: nicotinate phosphoribosyltransferase [Chitinophagaceae bacterium]|nr:MAG: nicotinate phosphoribosyltransferase [Chitinophagaceae bacterium]
MTRLILTSILDNDFYKFTMQQGVIRLFPYARARYEFINRGNHEFPPGFADTLRKAVNDMEALRLTPDEKRFLSVTSPYLDPVYLDFLEGYRYHPEEVIIRQDGASLSVHVEGLWYRAILWEVPLMSLICQLYYELIDADRVSDDEVIERIGTHAHEWFMFHAARYGFKMANAMALEHWVQVYRGDLGIALSDTYTTDVFLGQFDKMFSKLFDGVRHDSGDPLLFADKVIEHYRNTGINPGTKSIIFSDGLNYEKVARITAHCRGRINISFGIGTNFTNDAGPPALNIVIKMVEACPHGEGWTPVVKLSDERGKYTGDEDSILLAKQSLGIA